MRLIKPKPITDAVLVFSSVAEDEYLHWTEGWFGSGVSLHAWAVGERAIDPATHRIYQSTVADNVTQPSTHPDKWVEVGTTNQWSMFDEEVSSATTSPSTIAVRIATPEPCNSIALLGLSGHSAAVTVRYGGQIVYQVSVLLTDVNNEANWYSYYYTETVSKSSVVLMDLPSYAGAEVEVEVEARSAGAAIGSCILGSGRVLGITTYGASMGIQDYSQKSRDDFGRVTLVERSFSKKGNFTVEVPIGRYDAIYQLLASLRATAVLYIGTDAFESTLIYGFYKDFSMTIQYPTFSMCSIEIEGLT